MRPQLNRKAIMTFMSDDFLLHNDLAKQLYHEFVKDLPIIDYHCHLDPQDIYRDLPFTNLSDVWLSGDHYKWRLMRTYGIKEDYITGQASPEEKFAAWAEVVPHLFGNPVFHFTQLELKMYCHVTELLTLDNHLEVYKKANEALTKLSPQKIMALNRVECVCTTDDPVDSLEWHRLSAQNKASKTRILPTFRPDKAIHLEHDSFLAWLDQLSAYESKPIDSLASYEQALRHRLDHFASLGCQLADHALDDLVYKPYTVEAVDHVFKKRCQGAHLSEDEIAQFKTYMLSFFAQEYHQRHWVQQYHIGAYRNVNTKQYELHGPDSGFDAMHDQSIIVQLKQILDHLNSNDILPKTILYTLNPNHFDSVIPLMQAYQDGSVRGKLQFGSAWWFLDHLEGMKKQMRALQNYGLFASFIGMLTDSRSFLSYSRHDYFRRLLCQLVSEEVLKGYYPYDLERLRQLVQDIAYYNVKNYLNL